MRGVLLKQHTANVVLRRVVRGLVRGLYSPFSPVEGMSIPTLGQGYMRKVLLKTRYSEQCAKKGGKRGGKRVILTLFLR